MGRTLTLAVSPFTPPSSSQRPQQSHLAWISPSSIRQKAMQLWKLEDRNLEDPDFAAIDSSFRRYRMSDSDQKLCYELNSQATLSSLLLCCIEKGFINEAQTLWGEMINSSTVPSVDVISCLLDAYVKTGRFTEVLRILDEMASRGFSFAPQLYSVAVTCFGSAGQLEMMEVVVKDMVSRGFKVDSITGNEFVKHYSVYGSLAAMESAYERLKKSRILIETEAIRAMALAYVSQRKFYRLGEFLRDVGLLRRNTGNLLWNLLLLSFAANFKMKSLQREFLAMVDAGFSPDLTTFNIRALAFSRMRLFWDLHLSIEHMRFSGVVPDLVTYGCFVDAYLDRRLGRNLPFVLDRMNAESSPEILTDPLVFEAFGKGDFHSSSESFLEARRRRKWTYSQLIAVYVRKQYSNFVMDMKLESIRSISMESPAAEALTPLQEIMLEFRAGKMILEGTRVVPDTRKGLVRIGRGEEGLVHFQWLDRTRNIVEDDQIIFPDEAVFDKVMQSRERVFILKFSSDDRKFFFWMQEPQSDEDMIVCNSVNSYINRPLDIIGEEDPDASIPMHMSEISEETVDDDISSRAGNLVDHGMAGELAGEVTSSAGPVKLADLQRILRNIQAPAATIENSDSGLSLGDILKPELLLPLIESLALEQRLASYLPDGSWNPEDLMDLLQSPPFRQQVDSFTHVLRTGQIDLSQFGINPSKYNFTVLSFLEALEDTVAGSSESTGEPDSRHDESKYRCGGGDAMDES